MKELSTGQKAKAYDEAVKRAKALYDNQPISGNNVIIETIFPELKESEDECAEKIKKDIISYLNNRQITSIAESSATEKWIAWLEKQGEQNPYSGLSFEYNGHTFGMCARDGGAEILMDGNLKAFISSDKSFVYPVNPVPLFKSENFYASKDDGLIHDRTYNPADKVEPKFHIGDKIRMFRKGTVNEEPMTITKIDGKGYWSDDLFLCNFTDADRLKLVEQKPIDKFEPKFKVGDTIVEKDLEWKPSEEHLTQLGTAKCLLSLRKVMILTKKRLKQVLNMHLKI